MRYRITIELDTDENRIVVNQLAQRLFDEAVTRYTNPVYLATDKVEKSYQELKNSDRITS